MLVLARLHRTALEHLGVTAMPKVTGQRGIQIWVPVASGYTFDETRAWVEKLSRHDRRSRCPISSAGSGRSPSAAARLRLDYTQNAINKTLVAPFSTRPAPGARRCRCRSRGTSSTIPTCDPTAGRSTTIGERLADAGDPLAPLIGLRQRLPQL